MPRLELMAAGLPLAAALALAVSPGRAVAGESDPVPSTRPERVAPPKVSLGVLAGLALPACVDHQSCDGDGKIGIGPSLAVRALYAPTDAWALGVAAQLSRLRWSQTAYGMIAGAPPFTVASDLTTGLAGLAVRLTPRPAWMVAPIVEATVGVGFQESSVKFLCSDGLVPTGQLAVGGRARVGAATSIVVLASGTWGFKTSSCEVADASLAPFAGWGLGLQAGASFDIGLAGGRSGSALARR